MKASEFRDMSNEDLSKKLSEMREELFRLKLKKSTGHTIPLHQIKEIRRDIARIKTVLHEKNRLINV